MNFQLCGDTFQNHERFQPSAAVQAAKVDCFVGRTTKTATQDFLFPNFT
jgi:hypothetical protein